MKILVISPYFPWPLYSGALVRIFNLSKELSNMGHELHLLVGGKKYETTPLKGIFKSIYFFDFIRKDGWVSLAKSLLLSKPYPLGKYRIPHFQRELNKVLAKETFDVIFVNFAFMADLLPANLCQKNVVILDQHELELLIYQDYLKKGNFPEKIFALINLMKMKRFYQSAFSKVNVIFSVSEYEADLTRRYAKNQKVMCVPNGVSNDFLEEESYFSDENKSLAKKENIILFAGGLAIKRNVEAAKLFALNIFPLVKKEVPDAQFYMVGSWPNPDLEKLTAIAGVKLIGQVEDIKQYYNMAKVFVLPYEFGAGTKLKVFEAAASGIPIVATELANRGMPLVKDEHILLSKNEDEFAKNVQKIILDSTFATNICRKAFILVKERYLWSIIANQMQTFIKENLYGKI